MADEVDHYGSCHCQAVKWKVKAPRHLICIECNCSVCNKKANDHVIVEKSRFTLIQGEESLTTYTFNTHKAKHRFCKICGVQSFYIPRSNPDSIAVSPRCIDSDTLETVEKTYFDGQNWEKEMQTKAPVAL
ncbi:unnamed protein product [Auanema sp. JU1783]|nr:unnamed protein product [Auanema sp. JU1783]